MSNRPSLRGWLRRYSLALVAAIGGAAGVAYAASRPSSPPPAPAATATATAAAAVATIATGPTAPAEPPRDSVQDTVQIAIVLDTSSSMSGLINQARSHLWAVVDDMGKMTRVVNGKTRAVRVELALFEYGHQALSEAGGYMRQVLPLTTDLDRVSEELHRLSVNGGDEFAGQAIQLAVTSLQWSSDPAALKFVFLAGNESFDQGPITAKVAMDAARGKDIQVQLIHCGTSEPSWASAARLAGTDLTTIDQDHVAQHIPAPQDAEILQLGAQLNDTYVAYGAEGSVAKARQSKADAASAQLSPKVALERAQLKRKASYKNHSWDLVDAVENDREFLGKAADRDLPAELQGKSLEDKRRLVGEKAAARAELKAKIGKLEAERNAYLAKERAKQAGPQVQSLETEIMKPARKKAAEKGYKF
jgi:hypothetical protein